jgi:hypothetical protein
MRGLSLCLLLSLGPLAATAGNTPTDFDIGMNAMLAGDFAEAYCRWKPLARAGNAEAQYNLGWLYANGNGMNMDMKKAFYWWKQAAAQGHADAQFALGLSYTTGEGVKRDLETAARWFYKAAKLGHLDARDSLLRLAGDIDLDLLNVLPQLANEPWFGWTGRVSGDHINVRDGPGTGHHIVAKLSKGQSVRVVGRRGKWLRVRLPEDKGDSAAKHPPRLAWVYHSLLKPIGPVASRATPSNG